MIIGSICIQPYVSTCVLSVVETVGEIMSPPLFFASALYFLLVSTSVDVSNITGLGRLNKRILMCVKQKILIAIQKRT